MRFSIVLLVFACLPLAALAQQSGSDTRGYIGVALTDPPASARTQQNSRGALVAEVAPGGPADRAGIKPGDLVVAINGAPIDSAKSMRQIVIALAPNDSARLTVVRTNDRGRESKTITVVVSAPGASGPASAGNSGKATLAPAQQPTAPAAGHPVPAASEVQQHVSSSVGFTRLTDPLEHAFTMDVPAGWHAEGGLARLGALSINPYVRALSPDKMTYLLYGEPTLPTFSPLSPMMRNMGWREGRPTSSELVPRGLIMHYMPGAEFARSYGQTQLANLCLNVKFVSSRERPDLARKAQAEGQKIIPSRWDGGEAIFTCTHNKQEMEGFIEATTWMTQDSVMWVVQNLEGFLAPKGQAGQAQATLAHMVDSIQWDENWVQKQNNLSQQAAQSINRRVADMERQQVAFNEKLNAMDRNFQSMDDIITGTNHYYDAETGTKYDLSSSTPFKWIDSGGRIVGTQNDVSPPGFSWRSLQQAPGQ